MKSKFFFLLSSLIFILIIASVSFGQVAAPDAYFFDMEVFNNKLICGGYFGSNPEPYNGLVSWDGATWDTLGLPIGSIIDVIGQFNNELVIAAYGHEDNVEFGNSTLMKYDGSNWSMFGNEPQYLTTVKDMIIYNNQLVLGGGRFTVDGIAVRGVAVVDSAGDFQTLGSGTLGPEYSPNHNNRVNALEIFDGKLYAGGLYTYMDSIYSPGLSVYDGVSWAPVPGSPTFVKDMAVFQDELYVTSNSRIYKFDGSTWSELAGGQIDSGYIESIDAVQDYLFVCGDFTKIGDLYATNTAIWNGSCWGRVDDGTNEPVFTAYYYNGNYYLGGYFNTANALLTNGIAQIPSPLNPCVCCRNGRGNIDNDEIDIISISDLVQFVEYAFHDSSEPACFEEADIDNSGILDIGDIVNLVEYMFNSGEPPGFCAN